MHAVLRHWRLDLTALSPSQFHLQLGIQVQTTSRNNRNVSTVTSRRQKLAQTEISHSDLEKLRIDLDLCETHFVQYCHCVKNHTALNSELKVLPKLKGDYLTSYKDSTCSISLLTEIVTVTLNKWKVCTTDEQTKKLQVKQLTENVTWLIRQI